MLGMGEDDLCKVRGYSVEKEKQKEKEGERTGMCTIEVHGWKQVKTLLLWSPPRGSSQKWASE